MDLRDIARRYYRAFENHDRSFIENNLADGFTFTSPFDDHIGREEFFRRCWPAAPLHRKFGFAAATQDGETGFVADAAPLRIPNATHPEPRFSSATHQAG